MHMARKSVSSRWEGSRTVEPNRFIDLSLIDGPEDVVGKEMIKVADVRRFEDLTEISRQVYDGCIIFVDFSFVISNKDAVSTILAELKSVATDCGGDMVVVGKDMAIVSPAGIRIQRERIQESF